jgi:putative sigma-54 modulation protein
MATASVGPFSPAGAGANALGKEPAHMQLIITGKNLEVSEPLRAYVQDKIGKLDRYMDSISEANVELSIAKTKSSLDSQVVEVTLRSKNTILRAEQRSADMRAAIDAVRDKLQRQISRYKKKPIRVRERARAVAAQRATTGADEEPLPLIVRRKRFEVNPMSEDEAVEQMELLEHDFFLFLNRDTETLNVVYRRRDGNYGLLMPEVA